MTTEEAGRKGGKLSGDVRLRKGREAVLACKTARELLAVVVDLEHKAWLRGYAVGRRKGFADALGEPQGKVPRKTSPSLDRPVRFVDLGVA